MKKNLKCEICGGKMKVLIKGLYDERYGAKGQHDILKCICCGFGKTIPGIPKREIKKFYKKYYPLANDTYRTVQLAAKIPPRILAWLLGINNTAHYFVHPKEKVLDIGSGNCVSLLEIKKMKAIPYGVEPNPSSKLLADKLGVPVYCGFMSAHPFPNVTFDVITASQVLEHDPNPQQLLIDMKLRLKSDGRVILSFPNSEALYQKILGRRWIHWHVPYHLNFFTRRSFVLLAEKIGFRIYIMRTVTPNLWSILQLNMLLTDSKEGTKSSVWINKKEKNMFILIQTLKKLSQLILLILFTPINRCVDILGKGESFFVVLKKN